MVGDKKAKGSRRRRQEWRSLLAEFDKSGLGVEVFCRREAISTASFYRWRKLLSNEEHHGEVAKTVTTPAFIDLGTLSSAAVLAPRIDLTLELGDGLVLHLVRH